MAIDDVRLPVDIEQGAVGGPTWNTEITGIGSGAEQRRAVWSHPRQQWDVGYGVQSREDFQAVLGFFYARRGRLRGFRFRDWSDYQADGELFGTGDGAATEFQLVRRYGGFVRRITHPVDPIVLSLATGATIDYGTGVVTYADAPADGVALRWTGEFDVPVRFDVDALNANVTHYDAISAPSIPIVEIFE